MTRQVDTGHRDYHAAWAYSLITEGICFSHLLYEPATFIFRSVVFSLFCLWYLFWVCWLNKSHYSLKACELLYNVCGIHNWFGDKVCSVCVDVWVGVGVEMGQFFFFFLLTYEFLLIVLLYFSQVDFLFSFSLRTLRIVNPRLYFASNEKQNMIIQLMITRWYWSRTHKAYYVSLRRVSNLGTVNSSRTSDV